jgi:hypothetical protein
LSKQTKHRFHTEKLNLKKLKEVEANEQHRVGISHRFAALENLDTEVTVNSAWGTSRESIKIYAEGSHGYYEVKKHKP